MSSLLALDALAEARIEEAMAQGAFDDLPGAGHPLVLDDDRLVPEVLRAAYRILKNAGFVPPEVEARHERNTLIALITTLQSDEAKRRALTKLALLEARLEAGGGRPRRDRVYEGKLIERFG
ncbi:MAG TPA: DnaJ family domain-containing protein [Casimicrobiaceae bacterium]